MEGLDLARVGNKRSHIAPICVAEERLSFNRNPPIQTVVVPCLASSRCTCSCGWIWALVSGLPRRQREVVVMRHIAGLGEAEIAEALDIVPVAPCPARSAVPMTALARP